MIRDDAGTADDLFGDKEVHVMKLEKFLELDDDEPEAKCRNCEYFDGGGLTDEGKPVQDNGDCHNRASPYFTTSGNKSCRHFFPCSTRWPDADHG